MNKFLPSIIACWLLASVSPTWAADPTIPDPTLTPGVAENPPTPLSELCTPGRAKRVRHVSKAEKNQVFREYGYDPAAITRGQYEIDHLISLELDGTNEIKNLWPQSYVSKPFNAHLKDALEDKLHHMVCHHQIDLATAQQAIAHDWVAAYHQYVSATP